MDKGKRKISPRTEKIIIISIVVLLVIFILYAISGGDCLKAGCNEPVYKEGYCSTHYADALWDVMLKENR